MFFVGWVERLVINSFFRARKWPVCLDGWLSGCLQEEHVTVWGGVRWPSKCASVGGSVYICVSREKMRVDVCTSVHKFSTIIATKEKSVWHSCHGDGCFPFECAVPP